MRSHHDISHFNRSSDIFRRLCDLVDDKKVNDPTRTSNIFQLHGTDKTPYQRKTIVNHLQVKST